MLNFSSVSFIETSDIYKGHMSPALNRSSALQHVECSTWNKRWNNIHGTATYVCKKKQIFGFCKQHGSLVHEQWCWYQLMCIIKQRRQHRLSLVHKPMIYHVRVTVKPNTWKMSLQSVSSTALWTFSGLTQIKRKVICHQQQSSLTFDLQWRISSVVHGNKLPAFVCTSSLLPWWRLEHSVETLARYFLSSNW